MVVCNGVIKVFNTTIDNWTNQLIMGRVGYVLNAMCRAGYVRSLLFAELSHYLSALTIIARVNECILVSPVKYSDSDSISSHCLV